MDTSITQLLQQVRVAATYAELRSALNRHPKSPLTFAEGSALIHTAAELTGSSIQIIQENAHLLIEFVVYASIDHPITDYIPIIQPVFHQLTPRAQYAALWLLSKSADSNAATAQLDLIETLIVNGRSDSNFIYPFTVNPNAASVYFPRLLQLTAHLSVEALGRVCQLLLQYCAEGYLNQQLEQCIPFVLNTYQNIQTQLSSLPRPLNLTDEHYHRLRWCAGECLDLMGFLPASDTIQHELKTALALYRHEPHLLFYAVIALLKLGHTVEDELIYVIAGNHERRNILYQRLILLGKAHLFPPAYKTQFHFAISDMIQWLCFPTELGRPPDEIEFVQVVSISDITDQAGDYFVFRFRTHDMDKAVWEVGWSGPYPQNSEPGEVIGPTSTFSTFEQWGSKTPERFVQDWLTQD